MLSVMEFGEDKLLLFFVIYIYIRAVVEGRVMENGSAEKGEDGNWKRNGPK